MYGNLFKLFFDDVELSTTVTNNTKNVRYIDLMNPIDIRHSTEYSIESNEKNIIVHVLAPGISKEDISVNVDTSEKILKIKSNESEKSSWGKKKINLSLNLSSFRDIDFSSDIAAELENGILNISFSRTVKENSIISIKIS
jgi:HSP20 family molecular chaperone IbpA